MQNTRTVILDCIFFELWPFEMENGRICIYQNFHAKTVMQVYQRSGSGLECWTPDLGIRVRDLPPSYCH